MTAQRPISVLIAAMGGEGGGVLADWIVAAARHQGCAVQATSIPGVAQRTGATTYYLEMLPDAGSLPAPVFGLYPDIGDVDVVVASELVEAGRAIQGGYVAPERTTLIAATHRVYSIAEKTAMADGRVDSAKILEAARALAQRPILADFERCARDAGSALNAVLLGAIAASGALPIAEQAFASAVRARGVAVDNNLAGFVAGRDLVRAGGPPPSPAAEPARAALAGLDQVFARRLDTAVPEPVRAIARQGAKRLIDYQGPDYAGLYLDRLERVRQAARAGSIDWLIETARQLALRMSYEDVVRVAQLKTRPDRLNRIRREAGAQAGQPVVITEFLKPGLDEFCSLLPAFLGRPLLDWADRRGLRDKLNIGLKVRSSSLGGYGLLRLLAAMRRLRRFGLRFSVEQAQIERWLALVARAAATDPALALEIARCAGLIKGYGETYRRGLHNYQTIELLAEQALQAERPDHAQVAATVAKARAAALADPDGKTLAKLVASPEMPGERPIS